MKDLVRSIKLLKLDSYNTSSLKERIPTLCTQWCTQCIRSVEAVINSSDISNKVKIEVKEGYIEVYVKASLKHN